MKKTIVLGLMAAAALSASAQGNNTNMGGCDGCYASLAEKVLNLEKKTDAFQVYFNYAAALQAGDNGSDDWSSRFTNKQLRLEIKGNIGDHLSYRLRHRLNRNNNAMSEDNFAKATDIMMISWKFNDKWSLSGGKMCQIWGGFEFDENPMVIYQYSDFIDYMDNFMAGVSASYKPIPSQEFAVMVSNANNGNFASEWGVYEGYGQNGENPAYKKDDGVRFFEKSNVPFTYIFNWNGSFLNGMINTRWAGGVQTQAKDKYSYMLTLGQQLALPKFQWYIDYMGEWDDIDRLKIATSELEDTNGLYLGGVQYNSFITKANWQFAPKWNLMLKGMFEMASVADIEKYKNYRKSFGYIGAIEYYPIKDQDLRVSLSYIGRKFDYSEKSELTDYNTNRIEVGFMYRIKAF